MALLRPVGVLTGIWFGSGTEHAEFVVESGPNGPVVRVINYIQRVNVTLGLGVDAVATEAAVAEHRGARVPLTVDGWVGSITPLALTSARVGAEEGRSVSAFLSTALPTETQAVEILVVTTAGGETFLFAARPSGSGIGVFRLPSSGDPVPLSHLADTGETYLAGVRTMTSVRIGTETYLIAGSQGEDGLTVLRLGTGGSLTPVDSLGPAQLVPINDVMALRTVEIGGRVFVIAGSAGSSSLTVFEMAPDGRMQVIDHVVDSLGTRFQGVQQFEVVTVGDRVFVIAAGADDGLTLFTLLPDGRLLHLQTLADTQALGLSNVTALEVVMVNGQLQILAISGAEAGLTVIELDLSSLGALIEGGSGTVTGTNGNDLMRGAEAVVALNGGAGDDILIDGAGSQTLTGGAGADVFVFTEDGVTDTILDFDPTRDRIDLTLLPFFRNPSQVQVTYTTDGAILVFGDETIVVRTVNGRPLTPAQIALMTFGTEAMRFDVERGTSQPPRPVLNGTSGNDSLTGGAAGEDFIGGAGNDTLSGGGGDDLFVGGAGFDVVSFASLTQGMVIDLADPARSSAVFRTAAYDGIEGFIATDLADRLFGAGGNDWFDAAAGDDSLFGWLGQDTLAGGGGNDWLDGGTGADRLDGGAGADTIFGGWGNDTLSGGVGDDKMVGGRDDDSLSGATGNDTLSGGEGRDTLAGGDGNDVLDGGDDNDLLLGDAGSDRLSGGFGNDTLNAGSGGDTLDGGAGNDLLIGGSEADVFVFERLVAGERDTIQDFADGVDRIRISGLDGATPAQRFAELQILGITVDGVQGSLIRVDGHEIVVQGVVPSLLTLADFDLI